MVERESSNMSGANLGLAFALHCTTACTTLHYTGTKVARNCGLEVDFLWSTRDTGGRLEYQGYGSATKIYYGSEKKKKFKDNFEILLF